MISAESKCLQVVVIDDEPFVLKLITHQLGNLGFQDVIPCERARDAMALLEARTDSVGLVVCDLQMPEMDGVEFVRYLAGIGYLGDLLLVSGEDEKILHTAEKLASAHNLRILGSLTKPVTPDRLRQIVDTQRPDRPAASRTPEWMSDPSELRVGLARGELINHYQPKVDLATGAVRGVETLVRWKHPSLGLVYPNQFIPAAEEHGLIDDLTRTVFLGALKQARAWEEAGIHLHVAVNVSMDNLESLDIPNFVAREVARAGIQASSLVLEITETRLMKDPLSTLDVLTRLRLKHVDLSIDDFGTGHSSLAQLRDIPFDELKIDQGFVHHACRDASLRAILEASLDMAKRLDLRTVAEGVEDREDWDFLRTTGCDLAQGYFIARPMPPEDVLAWLPRWEARRGELVSGLHDK